MLEEKAAAEATPRKPTKPITHESQNVYVYGAETEHHIFLREQARLYWPHTAGQVEAGTSGGLPYFAVRDPTPAAPRGAAV